MTNLFLKKAMIYMKVYDIPNYTGYKISQDGKVYSVIKQGCRNKYDKSKWVKPMELVQRPNKKGYMRVTMRNDITNQRDDVYVHRIVAKMFIPNPNNYSDVNHKNSIVSDNRVDNLEWLSHKSNLEYGFLYGNKGRDEKGRFCHK